MKIDIPLDMATTQRWRRRMDRRVKNAAREAIPRAASVRSSAHLDPAPPVVGPRSAAQAAARAITSIALDETSENGGDGLVNAAALATVTEATDVCPMGAEAASASEPSPSTTAGTFVAGSSAVTSGLSISGAVRQSNASAISDACDDPDYLPPPPRGAEKPDLSSLAEAVDEAGTSSREAAALLSTQQGSVATRSKLRTALEKTRKDKLTAIADRTADCTAVFSDGRNDSDL